MKKTWNIIWKVSLVLIVCLSLVGAGYLYSNRDEIVTSKISMKYFEEVINKNDQESLKSFVANSNNDVLYQNFANTLEHNYHYEGVTDFKFKIVDKEIFGNGKYQCYFANAFENHVPKCDLKNEGRYMNYLVDIKVEYKLNDEEYKNNEKGLVVFAKDMVDGNYFTWKLVRFDRYIIEE